MNKQGCLTFITLSIISVFVFNQYRSYKPPNPNFDTITYHDKWNPIFYLTSYDEPDYATFNWEIEGLFVMGRPLSLKRQRFQKYQFLDVKDAGVYFGSLDISPRSDSYDPKGTALFQTVGKSIFFDENNVYNYNLTFCNTIYNISNGPNGEYFFNSGYSSPSFEDKQLFKDQFVELVTTNSHDTISIQSITETYNMDTVFCSCNLFNYKQHEATIDPTVQYYSYFSDKHVNNYSDVHITNSGTMLDTILLDGRHGIDTIAMGYSE